MTLLAAVLQKRGEKEKSKGWDVNRLIFILFPLEEISNRNQAYKSIS